MTSSKWVWAFPLVVLFLLITVTFVSWLVMSFGNFPERLLPGQEYQVGDRSYTVPDLPHTVYGSGLPASKERPIPVLREKTLINLRSLVDTAFRGLREEGITFWTTGGTLISALLWGHLMCYDDDCDVAVDWEDREYVWSDDFSRKMSERGLETFYLRGSSLEFATREGACVRLRQKGTVIPTMDIFFVREIEVDGEKRYAKVNSWGSIIPPEKIMYESKETWDSRDWIHPVRWVDVDGMQWPIPNQAEKCLDLQYGSEWKTQIKSPKPLTNSHRWAFWYTNLFNAWRVGPQVEEQVES